MRLPPALYWPAEAVKRKKRNKQTKPYLALLPQLLHHLRLDLLQHRLRLLRHRRIAGRKVVPFQLAQRPPQALRIKLLQTGGARAGSDGRLGGWRLRLDLGIVGGLGMAVGVSRCRVWRVGGFHGGVWLRWCC